MLKFLLACLGPYLLIMSFSQTKAMWYVAPLYPLVAMLAGLKLHFLWKKLAFVQWRPMFAGLLLLAVFYYPYQRVLAQALAAGGVGQRFEDVAQGAPRIKPDTASSSPSLSGRVGSA